MWMFISWQFRQLSLIPIYEHDTDRYDGRQHDKPGNETEQAVGGDKADNGSARRHLSLIHI